MKKDNHYGEYSFNACLPRPTLIPPPLPLTLPVETTTNTTSNRFLFIIIIFIFIVKIFIFIFIAVLVQHHYVLFDQILLHQMNQQIRLSQILMVRKYKINLRLIHFSNTRY
jgi:hypothetical protein